jgi:Ca2+-binding RTX toxin-like protein
MRDEGNPDSSALPRGDILGQMSRGTVSAGTWGRHLALALGIVAYLVAVAPVAVAARTCEGLQATVSGSRHADVLRGTSGDDVIVGLGGDDEITGRGGNDLICGGDGKDTIVGGPGGDTLSGGDGKDSLDGGDGEDIVSYAGSPAGVKVDLFAGTAGGWGKDTIVRVERATGSSGDDTLAGGGQPSVLRGGDGNDTLTGGRDDDILDGGDGDDAIDGGGGRGDIATFALAPNAVTVNLATASAAGWGADTLARIQIVVGSAFDDVLVGDAERTTFLPGPGNDVIDGGGGGDTVDFSGSPAGVQVDLAAGTATGEGSDTLTGIVSVTGSSAGDQILGDSSRNTLTGGAGDDAISGREGNDDLDGGEGTDVLDGGQGNDGCANGETLTDCET